MRPLGSQSPSWTQPGALLLGLLAGLARRLHPGARVWHPGLVALALVVALVGGSARTSQAATGTLYAAGVAAPGGLVWLPGSLGGHLWISDHIEGFCRLDPAPTPGTFALNRTTCSTAMTSPGQPAYDPATNFVYIPDNAAVAGAQGVWRLTFNPTTERITGATPIATIAALGAQKPTGAALGPGGLYVSFIRQNSIVRITDPATAPAVEVVGNASGRSAFGLALVGADLYLAEDATVSRIDGIGSCTAAAPCLATPVSTSASAPAAVASDGAGFLYIADVSVLWRLDLASGTVQLYASSGQDAGGTQELVNVSALAFDPAGNLFFADDPSAGAGTAGRIWTTPAGAPPGGALPGLRVAALVVPQDATPQGVTGPSGLVWLPGSLGGHFWVADHFSGFCRLDPATTPGQLAINPTTCNTAAASPGQPAVDAVNNLIYIPDNAARTGSQGVWRLTFNPTTERITGAAPVVSIAALGAEKPTGAVLAPEGLYVSFIANGNVVRVSSPGAGASVEVVAATSDGRGGFSLALIGPDLYVAEGGAVATIENVAGCSLGSPCAATPAAVTVAAPAALLYDGSTYLYITDASVVRRLEVATGTSVLYTSGGIIGTTTTPYQNVSALGFDATGVVYLADDPTAGGGVAQGRIWAVRPNADLAVTKGGAPNPVMPGATLTYTIGVSNGGPDPATNATLTDTTPANTAFQSVAAPAGWTCTTPAVGGTGTITCTNLSLAAAAADTFTVVLDVSPAAPVGSTVTNSAAVSAPETDPDPADNSAAVTTRVGLTADLSVTKGVAPATVLPGGTLTYTLAVGNAGPDAATSVVLTDPVPANVSFQSITAPAGWSCTTPAVGSTGTVSCTTGSLAASGSASFTVTGQASPTAPGGSTLANTATVSSATTDTVPANDSASASATVAFTADLSVTKGVAPATVLPGGTLTYTIAVGNAGPDAATSVTLTDPLPANVSFQSVAAPAGWVCSTPAVGSTGTVSCTAGSLAASGSASFTVTGQVSPTAVGGSTLANTATVSSATADMVPANDSASASATVAFTADLSVTKSASASTVVPGATLTYTIVVGNAGPDAASSVALTDPLPANVGFQSVAAPAGWVCSTPAVGSSGTVSCAASSLAAGSSATLTLVVQVGPTAAVGSSISNTATGATATVDLAAANDAASATVGVVARVMLPVIPYAR